MTTPYTIRERRANIANHAQAEAYPGQREKLLADLIASDREKAEQERERAAEALHGGRYITEALAKTLQGWDATPTYPGLRARFAGEDGPEKLADIWRYTASPSGAVHPSSGRDTTARYAQSAARIGGVDWEHSAYWQAPKLPEAAFDWPVYRAAMQAETYADLWSQAGEGEERVLDTLARASGITTPTYLVPGSAR